jgi:hypothetical protein
VRVELAEHLREEPGGVAGPVRRVQLIPDRRKRGVQVAEQIRQHLPHGLRLPRQLGEMVAVVNGALAEPQARVVHAGAVAAADGCQRSPETA